MAKTVATNKNGVCYFTEPARNIPQDAKIWNDRFLQLQHTQWLIYGRGLGDYSSLSPLTNCSLP